MQTKKLIILIFDREAISFVVFSSVVSIINMANSSSDGNVLSLAEVKQLAEDKNKCILLINNRIYDVTKFIDEVCKNSRNCFLFLFELFSSIRVVKKF